MHGEISGMGFDGLRPQWASIGFHVFHFLPISLHPMDQQGPPCYHTFLTVTSSYHSKVKFVGPLDAEKLAEAGFLYVFNIGFSASLFSTTAQYPWAIIGFHKLILVSIGFKSAGLQ